MADAQDKIRSAGATVVAFGPGSAAEASRVRSKLDLPFPVVGMGGIQAHKTFGLGKGWMGLILESGTAVVDAEGTVRYLQKSRNPGGALDMTALMKVLGELASS